MKELLLICDTALLERLKVKTKYKWLQSHAKIIHHRSYTIQNVLNYFPGVLS